MVLVELLKNICTFESYQNATISHCNEKIIGIFTPYTKLLKSLTEDRAQTFYFVISK